jgi:hypothetical protein
MADSTNRVGIARLGSSESEMKGGRRVESAEEVMFAVDSGACRSGD